MAESTPLPANSTVRTLTTTRSDGDFAVSGDPAALAENRRRIVELPWVWLRQVHGSRVVQVTAEDAGSLAGTEADGVVTADAGVALAIHTADCLPVVLSSSEGVIGAAHAGWRGLLAGVVERTVDAMRVLGATEIEMAAGPAIGPECYEFGPDELAALVERFGPDVGAVTSRGASALDLRAALATIAGELRVVLAESSGQCTACRADRWFSYRARGESARMATLILRDPPKR